MKDQTYTPQINLQSFPYKRKWTKEETDRIEARFDEYKTMLTDIVGPSGQRIYIDPSITAVQALHLALADLGFIEYRVRADARGMFENTYEWRVAGEFEADDPFVPAEEVERRVLELNKQMREEIEPEVLHALRKKIAEEFTSDMDRANKSGRRVTKEGQS